MRQLYAILPEEITDFCRPVPPCTDERVRAFQFGDKAKRQPEAARVRSPISQTQLKSSSLLTTVRDASIGASSTSMARPPSPIDRLSAKIPKRPNSTIAGGAGEANYEQ
jgi:hypothetical protein